jgi:hypothetical protein
LIGTSCNSGRHEKFTFGKWCVLKNITQFCWIKFQINVAIKFAGILNSVVT